MKERRYQPADEPTSGDEGFLSRWSRLKNQAREDEVSETLDQASLSSTPGPTKPRPSKPASSAESASEAEVYHPTDADMPPLESLDEHSDYSGFMSPRVSEELRRLALRKLFHTPSFHFRDGLDDYDEDFTKFTPLGDTITADMKFRAEMEAERQQRELQSQTQQHITPAEALPVEVESDHQEIVAEQDERNDARRDRVTSESSANAITDTDDNPPTSQATGQSLYTPTQRET